MKLLLILLPLLFAPTIQAGVYQCTVNGKVTFQALPCESGDQTVLKASNYNQFGMHDSWFQRPGSLPEDPQCRHGYCFCGNDSWSINKDERTELLNSMSNLRSAWKNHNPRYQMSTKEACRMAIYQNFIKNNFETVADRILADYENSALMTKAEQLECPKPNLEGWTRSEEARRWARCIREQSASKKQSYKASSRSAENYFSELMKEYELLHRPRPMH